MIRDLYRGSAASKIALVAMICASLAGCAASVSSTMSPKPTLGAETESRAALMDLPPAKALTTLAVYQFADQTGQFKQTESQQQSLSRALSQGADSLLIQALRDAGAGRWFSVVERNRLDDLIRERRLITESRLTYLNERRINSDILPPLIFAGAIVQGGVIGFDTNVRTGGLGARFLGIGGSTQYRESVITVALRLVSVKTGQVVASVTARKTLISVGIQGGLTRFVAFKRLLEAEAGITANEPELVALQQAIEHAVVALVVQGTRKGIWSFADADAGEEAMSEFERDNNITQLEARLPQATRDEMMTPISEGQPNSPPRAIEGCRRTTCPEGDEGSAPPPPKIP